MTHYLTSAMKQQMMNFVFRDLWDGNWMRALALYDSAAQKTLNTPQGRATLQSTWQDIGLRPDHGVTGSYAAWPALLLRFKKLFRGMGGELINVNVHHQNINVISNQYGIYVMPNHY